MVIEEINRYLLLTFACYLFIDHILHHNEVIFNVLISIVWLRASWTRIHLLCTCFAEVVPTGCDGLGLDEEIGADGALVLF